jgi:N-acetylglucosamine kinase-like BadF-type ATPase
VGEKSITAYPCAGIGWRNHVIETRALMLETIMTIITIIGAAVTVYFAIRSKPREIRKLDGEVGAEGIESIGDALRIAREAALQVADMSNALNEEKKKNRYELDGLRMEVNELKFELDKATAEIEVLRDWAERLVHQVQSLGAEPVKMKQPRKVSRE